MDRVPADRSDRERNEPRHLDRAGHAFGRRAAHHTGRVYPIIAAGLGAIFVGEALLLLRRSRTSDDLAVLQPMRLFHFSNSYLTLLFLAVALVPFLR